AEDAWRMRRDFTLTLGLRFERNTFSDAAKDFSPRFGFSWQPFGDQKTVVRGSYGIFYSQLRANLQASFALNRRAGLVKIADHFADRPPHRSERAPAIRAHRRGSNALRRRS